MLYIKLFYLIYSVTKYDRYILIIFLVTNNNIIIINLNNYVSICYTNMLKKKKEFVG